MMFILGYQDNRIIESTDRNRTMSQGKYFFKGETFPGKVRQ
jgi:hypothetical protein